MAREIHGNIFYRYIKLACCNSTGKSMSLNPMFRTERTSHTFSMVGKACSLTIKITTAILQYFFMEKLQLL